LFDRRVEGREEQAFSPSNGVEDSSAMIVEDEEMREGTGKEMESKNESPLTE